MTTEKQILANRRNGALSRGPKTVEGKVKSRRNAFRHGLSKNAAQNPALARLIEQLAQTLTDDPGRFAQAMVLAAGEVDLARVRTVRAELFNHQFFLSEPDSAPNSNNWSRIEKLERYERRALTRIKRGSRALDELPISKWDFN
jgi:hypothetical protein